MYQGSCLCGAVKYEIDIRDTRLKTITHCHCSMCRKAHGAAFGSYVAVPARAFRFAQGDKLVASYRSSGQVVRRFCQRCGSTLTWQDQERFKDWISVTVGTLDTPLDYMPQQHAFTWSKADWHEIRDNFQKHRYGVPALAANRTAI
ncbi:MAG TPA: GFA family protein [Paucimonas sp.]|nr:GFA family protein [Paucimonas sp.]